MFKKRKIAGLLSILLVFGLVISGLSINVAPIQAIQFPKTNPELTKIKDNLDTNGLMYITDDSTIPSVNTIDYQQQNINTMISRLNSADIAQLDLNKFKNIAINTDQLINTNTLDKIKEAYNQGARIIFRKDNITEAEVYRFLGSKIPYYLSGEQQSNSKLTTVAISVFKDSSGIDHVASLNVENNNLNEVLRVMIVASRDDKDTFKLFMNPEDIIKTSFIQFGKPAYASLSTTWPCIAIKSTYDQWETVNINWVTAIYRDPNNPVSGSYIDMGNSGITVTPRSGYTQGYSYIYHDSASGGQVQFYQPTPLTAKTSYNINFGYPPSTGFSVAFNYATSIYISGASGCSYTQWAFTPVITLGNIATTTDKQTYYEGADQYYQPGSSFSQGFSYTVKMYKGSIPYATASSSRYLYGQ